MSASQSPDFSTTSSGGATEAAAARRRITIIDDEAPFTRMVKMNLESTGSFEVQEVNWAPAAMPAVRKFMPDLILLDVVMPTVDGGELAARLQADPVLRGTPIIFLTATVSKRESARSGLNSGGFLFLAKPVSQADLIRCINDHVRVPLSLPPSGPDSGTGTQPTAS